MWINLEQCVSSVCSPASEDSSEALPPDLPTWASMLAASAWWRGKRSEPGVWKRRCAAATWLLRLSGSAMSGSSPRPSSLAQWTSWWRASRASPLPPPGSAREPTTSGGYGPRLSEWRKSLGLATSSARTSADCSTSTEAKASRKSSSRWPTSGSMRSGRCCPRPPLVLRTDGSGCSSSDGDETWLTPCGMTGQDWTGKQGLGGEFAKQATNWPTPAAQEVDGPPRPSRAATGRTTEYLGRTVGLWTTPQAHDVTERGSGQTPTAAAGNACLARDARLWPTPDAQVMNDGTTPEAWERFTRDSKAKHGSGNGHGTTLGMASRLWPTATSGDSRASGRHTTDPDRAMHPGTSLTDAGRQWATPKTPTGGAESRQSRQSRGSGGEDLEAQATANNWPTAGANDWKGSHRPGQRRGQLDEAAEQRWPTPRAEDSESAGERVGRGVKDTLTAASRSLSLPGPASESSGDASSPQTPTSRRPRLNPTFVEWMMGFPRGWTDPRTWGCPTPSSRPERHSPISPHSSPSASEPASKPATSTRTDGTSRTAESAPGSTDSGSGSSKPSPTTGTSETSRTDSELGSLWPTPSAGNAESGQTEHSSAARRGGGDSRLRVTAAQFRAPKPGEP